MLKYSMTLSLICIFTGGICFNLPANYENYYYDADTPQNGHYTSRATRNQINKRKIAYLDERDKDIHHRAERKGNWNYKQNWRYDRKAFFSGETQGEAYDRETPDGIGGAGIDPDTEYLQMHQFYLDEARRNRQQAQEKAQSSAYAHQNHTKQQNQNSNHRKNNSNQEIANHNHNSQNQNRYNRTFQSPSYDYNQNFNLTYPSSENPYYYYPNNEYENGYYQ